MKFNFSLSTKLFINNFFYAIPILVLLYLMFNSYDKDLLFGQKEVMGNDIQKTTMELLNLVVKSKKYTEDMNPLMSEVLKKMEYFEKDLLLDSKSLHDRKRDQLQKIEFKKAFDEFKTGKVDAYKILKDLRELVIHTGDTSNLILDPDLDSYYMMDVTLIAIPQMVDRFYEIENFLSGLLRKPKEVVSVEDKVKMSVYLAMLRESDWGRVFADIGTAINEDKNFYGINRKLQNDIKNKADVLDSHFKSYFVMLEEIAKGDKGKSVAAHNMTIELINENHTFYLLTNQVLTDLLEARATAIAHNRNKATGIGIGAILIALMVSLFTSINFKNGAMRVSYALRLLMGAVEVNAETSKKLTESSTGLSAISTQQASAVQQTVSSLHEINAMSEKNFDSIRLSSKKTVLGKEHALKGKKSIYMMASTIKDIANSNEEFFEEVKASNDELKIIIKIILDISKKTRVINDIVFQTRILSFNASVEAARAGEHGKGFSVVAEEIGKLALMSGKSAKEINEILNQATNQVENIITKLNLKVVDLTSKGRIQIVTGEKITEECVSSLNEIVENVSELSEMMSGISTAITEQGKGYGEIAKSIDQIDEGVHHGLGLSKETSVHAKILHNQVAELKIIASTIEKEVLGNARTA